MEVDGSDDFPDFNFPDVSFREAILPRPFFTGAVLMFHGMDRWRDGSHGWRGWSCVRWKLSPKDDPEFKPNY